MSRLVPLILMGCALSVGWAVLAMPQPLQGQDTTELERLKQQIDLLQKQIDLFKKSQPNSKQIDEAQKTIELLRKRQDELQKSQPAKDEEIQSLPLKNVSGWVMLPDGVTLIVGMTNGKLVYIDTVAVKELKQVDAPARPDFLAVQGKLLFVASRDASAVQVIDRDTGEAKKEIKLPAGGLGDLVCHPEKGLVYAATEKGIAAIDPEAGTATLTSEYGQHLAVDPSNPNTLYAVYILQGKKVAGGIPLVKLTAKGKALEKVAVNEKAAYDGQGLTDFTAVRVGVDGKRVGVTAADGYIPKTGPDLSRTGKPVGLFSAKDINTLDGIVISGIRGGGGFGSPRDLAFHPVLDLGATEEYGSTTDADKPKFVGGTPGTRLHLFNSKSLAEFTTFFFPRKQSSGWQSDKLLTIGARGTKLIYYDGNGDRQLRFIPLPLNDEQKKALAKAYPPAGK